MDLRVEFEQHGRKLDATDLAIQMRLGEIETLGDCFGLISTEEDIFTADPNRVVRDGLLEAGERRAQSRLDSIGVRDRTRWQILASAVGPRLLLPDRGWHQVRCGLRELIAVRRPERAIAQRPPHAPEGCGFIRTQTSLQILPIDQSPPPPGPVAWRFSEHPVDLLLVVKLNPFKGFSDRVMGVAMQVELHDQLEHWANSPSIAGKDLTNVRRPARRGVLCPGHQECRGAAAIVGIIEGRVGYQAAQLIENLTASARTRGGHLVRRNPMSPVPNRRSAHFNQSQQIVGEGSQHHGREADGFELLSENRQLWDIAGAAAAEPSGIDPLALLGNWQWTVVTDNALQPRVLLPENAHRLERALSRRPPHPLQVSHDLGGSPLQQSLQAGLQWVCAQRLDQRRVILGRHGPYHGPHVITQPSVRWHKIRVSVQPGASVRLASRAGYRPAGAFADECDQQLLATRIECTKPAILDRPDLMGCSSHLAL